MNFFRLLRLLILRNIKEEKFLTFLSVIGIALGIGLFAGVKVASDRAITSFESDIRGIDPYANYEVVDTSGIDFDEKIYKKVRGLEEDSFPVLKIFGYVPAFRDAIDINAVYTVKAVQFLGLEKSRDGFLNARRDLEDFYRLSNGIMITRKYAEKHALKKGDSIKALVYDKEYPMRIVGILDSGSLLANTVVMDLGNFQDYFDKTGRLSRIDLSTSEKTAAKIKAILPPGLGIEKKEEIFRNRKALVASFRYNLRFISLIAILAGVFLLYNTVFITVVKRRTEIGILRGLGASRKTVIMLFTSQGALLGVIGSLIGILLGQFAAYFSVAAVERTISTLYSPIAISDYMMTGRDALTAFSMGIFVSFLASAVPAFESSRIRPNETSREGSFEGKYRKYQKYMSLAGSSCILLGVLTSFLDYKYAPFEFPVLAYSGILLIIAGFTLLCPFYLSLFLKVLERPSGWMFRAIGKITLGDMKGKIYRFSVALMSVAISCALIIALLTLIFSLRESLRGWINKNVVADVYIKPASCGSNYCFYPLSPKLVGTVKSFPEVEGIDRFRAMRTDLFGKKVVTAFADVGVKRKFLESRHADRAYERTLKEMEGGEPVAGISEYLSIKYGLKKGDSIELKSPAGTVTFRVNDISSSYATTSGFIYIDRKWLGKYWGLDDATQMSIYLKKGTDVQQFIYRLREKLPPDYSLRIMNNRELRDGIMDIFNRSFSITYAIELISVIVSLIGVVNALLALVFERKREISIIRYLGGSWKQIGLTLTLSAGIIGVAGAILGAFLGLLMSGVLIYVVNKISFGWEIHFRVPIFYLFVVMTSLFLTTLFAGLLPARVARKIDPERFASFE
jgi:putative ABC transport system permease protein